MGHRSSGEGGIRTPGPIAETQHFQCCTIGRSVTSPRRDRQRSAARHRRTSQRPQVRPTWRLCGWQLRCCSLPLARQRSADCEADDRGNSDCATSRFVCERQLRLRSHQVHFQRLTVPRSLAGAAIPDCHVSCPCWFRLPLARGMFAVPTKNEAGLWQELQFRSTPVSINAPEISPRLQRQYYRATTPCPRRCGRLGRCRPRFPPSGR